MKEIDITEEISLGGIFSIPGEGLVIELVYKDGPHLYDKQGLQYLILEKNRLKIDSTIEQIALSRLKNTRNP